MGSNRLRGKSLMPVASVPLLQRVVELAQSMEFINEVWIATTLLDEDRPIEAMANHLGVQVFRGSALNVLERFYKASVDMDEADTIVRMTADNLWNNLSISCHLHQLHVQGEFDYSHIDGLSHVVVECINVRALRRVYTSSGLTQFDKEHVTPFFRRNKAMFKVNTLAPDYMGLRHDLDKYLTIDTVQDLHRVEGMMEALDVSDNPTDFGAIYEYLDKSTPKIDEEISDSLVSLAGIPVGPGYPTYVIAEIGQNHNGSIAFAERLIDMAVRCGANAVKFQKRDIASELTKEAFDKPYDNPNSFGKTYGEHRNFLELDEEAHTYLHEYAMAKGITYFCTPCDIPSVELLERIGCPFYKVASRDLTNLPFLEKLATLDKPVIISTGMSDLIEIDDALEVLKKPKNKLIVLQCTSEYPCKLEHANLKAMDTLRERYGVIVGLSDHTSGVIVAAVASATGAHIIEKHITLDRTMKGTDQPGSLEESGLKKLIEYIRAAELAMGDGVKEIEPAVTGAREKLARSLVSSSFIKKGTRITEEMLTLKSPGNGFKWKEKDLVIGRVATRDIPPDVTIQPNFIIPINP